MTADEELINYLGQYITENKRSKIEAALEQRTRRVTILLEEVYQPHNASASLRNCDCLGIQDVHIVEHRHAYQPNPNVSMGSSKWLTLFRYQNSQVALEVLRNRGYRIVATTPHHPGYNTENLPLDQPLVLLFGTEEMGLKEDTILAADDHLCLPMYGFTQSFNVSVSVAIILSRIAERLRNEGGAWGLTEREKTELKLQWYRGIVTRHELLEKEYWDKKALFGKA